MCVIFCVCNPSSLPETQPPFQGRTIPDTFDPWLDRHCHSLRQAHGYNLNEVSVLSPESPLLKFAKIFYESPLVLLCGSAVVSAIMGNVDDAVSASIAIVLIGM